jgi:7-cyano-7-deazaguanine synthase
MNKKCLTLCSGGLDSIALLYWLEHQNMEQHILFFDYNQKAFIQERDSMKKHATLMKRKSTIIDIYCFGEKLKSSLIMGNEEVPNGRGSLDPAVAKKIYVPYRNLIFLSMAVSLAEEMGIDKIYTAVYGSLHGDTSAHFIEALNQAVFMGRMAKPVDEHNPAIRISAPFANIDRTQVIRMANKKGIPIHDSWSCYKDYEHHCGNCNNCLGRKRAFEEAGVEDKTTYMD